MRICPQCKTEMREGFNVKIEGRGNSIEIGTGSGFGFFSPTIGRPNVAVCPECGEISLYIENIKEILQD